MVMRHVANEITKLTPTNKQAATTVSYLPVATVS